MKLKIVLSFLLIHFLSLAGKDFDKAIEASNKRDFKTAAQLFEKEIISDSSNSSAYFNLGNCYFELKQYGKAIWAFEKVLKYKPSDDESIESIELCYSKLGTHLMWKPSLKGIERIVVFIGSNTFAFLAVIIALLMAFSIYRLFREEYAPRKRFHKIVLVFEILILITFLYTAKVAADFSRQSNFAVVTKKSMPAFADGKDEKESMTLNEGEKLHILESNERSKVQRMDGSVIWVNTQDIEVI